MLCFIGPVECTEASVLTIGALDIYHLVYSVYVLCLDISPSPHIAHIRTHARMHARTYPHTHTPTHTHPPTHPHTHIPTRTHTPTHPHTHTTAPYLLFDLTLGACFNCNSGRKHKELTPSDGDQEVHNMKLTLKYNFMNPFEKWTHPTKRQFPWKLLVQLLSIILVTTQVSWSWNNNVCDKQATHACSWSCLRTLNSLQLIFFMLTRRLLFNCLWLILKSLHFPTLFLVLSESSTPTMSYLISWTTQPSRSGTHTHTHTHTHAHARIILSSVTFRLVCF